MPTFETPDPIIVSVELGAGELRITASDRADTVVEVRPSDDTDESDVQAAEQVRVDYADGTLRVTGPRARALDFSRKTRSVDVTVEVPTGSQLTARMQAGDVRGVGRLGECRVTTSAGNVRVERTGALRVDTSAGHVSVDAVTGDAEISTGSGKVEIGEIDGTATIKNSNGATRIDAVTGTLRVRSANGDITVDRAGAGVEAKTSNGSILLGEVSRGSINLATAMGDLEVGIAEGTGAWLDVDTGFGHVRNLLDEASRPGESDETAEVHGHTSYGDVLIRRS